MIGHQMRLAMLGVACFAATTAAAITSSPVPKPRPGGDVTFAPVFGPTADTPRPRLKPRNNAGPVQGAGGLTRSLIPKPRPRVGQRQANSVVAAASPAPANGKIGPVCGRRDILGVQAAPIAGTKKGCGVAAPVQVTSVSGVTLSTPVMLECKTAKALNSWVADGVKPSIKRLGGGVASLQVASGYSCRTRNNQPGSEISEHGKGRAIDISAINLKNGKQLNVLTGWGKGTDGKLLRQIHKAACGPFTTVLGPEADRYHQDHFHLDTARHRGGRYCR